MMELITLTVVVFCLSIVQSLFGVGLLVFGTPTLLMFGYSFEETISYLLPCSCVVSLMQTLTGSQYIATPKYVFPLYCLPTVVIGLSVVLIYDTGFDIANLVGFAMIATAIIRLSKQLRRPLEGTLKKFKRTFIAIIGLIHGLTNMGGGLLTILMSSTLEKKESITFNIAYGYLLMGVTQIITLFIVSDVSLGWTHLGLASLAGFTYGLIGRFMIKIPSQATFNKLITTLTLGYGIVLLL